MPPQQRQGLLPDDLPREAAHHQILGRLDRVVVIAKQVAVVAATRVEIARGRERGENGVAVDRIGEVPTVPPTSMPEHPTEACT